MKSRVNEAATQNHCASLLISKNTIPTFILSVNISLNHELRHMQNDLSKLRKRQERLSETVENVKTTIKESQKYC